MPNQSALGGIKVPVVYFRGKFAAYQAHLSDFRAPEMKQIDRVIDLLGVFGTSAKELAATSFYIAALSILKGSLEPGLATWGCTIVILGCWVNIIYLTVARPFGFFFERLSRYTNGDERTLGLRNAWIATIVFWGVTIAIVAPAVVRAFGSISEASISFQTERR